MKADEARMAREDEKAPIAVVGVACRLPGASGHEDFWRSLREGVDTVGEIDRVRSYQLLAEEWQRR